MKLNNCANNKYKVSISHVDLNQSSSAFPKFTVSVRLASDSDEQPTVLESFSDVNLDPNNKNYICRVIGDRFTSFDLTQDPPEVLYNGDFPNRSQFVRVTMSDPAPAAARPAGFQGVSSNLYTGVSGDTLSASTLPMKSNHLNSNNAVDRRIFIGFNDMA